MVVLWTRAHRSVDASERCEVQVKRSPMIFKAVRREAWQLLGAQHPTSHGDGGRERRRSNHGSGRWITGNTQSGDSGHGLG